MESIILLFDFPRGSVSECFVEAFVIIIPFDIFKESQANLFNVFKETEPAQPFGFQFSPEAFTGSVIPTFSLSAHTLDNAESLEL